MESGYQNLAHDEFFNELVKNEYGRLRDEGHVYLDYTGGNLYSQRQLDEHFKLLKEHTFGNPHSSNPTSVFSTKLVNEARQKVLDFFNANDYWCVFTQNASNALKIVGESYQFNKDGRLLLLADNHNSVNGIREYCKQNSCNFMYSPIRADDLRIDDKILKAELDAPKEGNNLFGYPAQSNVSGVKHDLSWIKYAQERGWDVLLDAAAYVPTSPLDLSEVTPDFVSMSFYKIFGYPTGIGALLIRKSAMSKLHKRWFAGGTVTLASVASDHFFLTNNHERYEDGTINYLGIPAITIGLDHIERIGIQRINERVMSLTEVLYNKLRAITHSNGKPVVHIFGPSDRDHVGGTLIMTFFDKDGAQYPFEWVEELTNQKKISIRSGCFCNPGIDEINNQLTAQELVPYFSTRDQGDYHDMINHLHKLRGAIRVSLGLATTRDDLAAFMDFVKTVRDKSIEEARAAIA